MQVKGQNPIWRPQKNSRKVINRFESDTYQNRENLTNAELDQISVATLKKFAAMVSIS